ncbi:MAG: hypothetical protein AB1847_10590 [bacterium]
MRLYGYSYPLTGGGSEHAHGAVSQAVHIWGHYPLDWVNENGS